MDWYGDGDGDGSGDGSGNGGGNGGVVAVVPVSLFSFDVKK